MKENKPKCEACDALGSFGVIRPEDHTCDKSICHLEEKKCEHKEVVLCDCPENCGTYRCKECKMWQPTPVSPSDKTWEEPSIEYIAKDFINSIEGTDKDWKIRRLIDLLTSATIKAKRELLEELNKLDTKHIWNVIKSKLEQYE